MLQKKSMPYFELSDIKNKYAVSSLVLSVVGMLLLLTAMIAFFRVVFDSYSGVIEKSSTWCDPEFGNKCVSEYVLKLDNGSSVDVKGSYLIDTIPAKLEAGTNLEKKIFSLGYSVNGEYRQVSVLGHMFKLFSGVVLLCLAYYYKIRSKSEKA